MPLFRSPSCCVYFLFANILLRSSPLHFQSNHKVFRITHRFTGGIASISWFIANQNLGFAVSFPIITSGPGFIGALWGIFRFGEISGKRNFIFLAVAFGITLPGLVLVALSH